MGKLIKYEFRKQLLSKIVVACVIGGLEAFFFLGLIVGKDDWIGMAMGLFVMAAVFSLIYFSFEAIITYSNDLKTKQSYMIFLTPCNMFQVVGAKLITTIVQIVLVGGVYLAIGIINGVIIVARYGSLKQLIEVITQLLDTLSGMEIRLMDFAFLIVMFLVTWMVFVAMAMFAITLSTTVLSNKKGKGVLSIALYFFIDWLVMKLASLVTPTGMMEREYLVVNSEAWAYIGVYAVALVLCYIGTSLLLEKKVSV